MPRSYMLRVRLNEGEVARLDKARGKLSRSEYVRRMFGPMAIVSSYIQYSPPPADPVLAKAIGEYEERLKKKAKRPNHYCKAHHVLGCLTCD